MKHILVTGSHRSGTTWVGKMIARAENVHYISEIFNPERDPGRCRLVFDRWYMYLPSDVKEPYYSALKDVLDRRQYDLWKALRTAPSLGQVKARLEEYLTGLPLFSQSRPRSLLKDPIAVFSAEWLAKHFNMDVVVMIRHPAGFVSSLLRHGFDFPFQDLRSQEQLIEDMLLPFRKEIIQPPGEILDQAILLWRMIYYVVHGYRKRYPEWHFICYEDLSSAPLTGFEALYQQLNLRWTPAATDAVQEHSRKGNPTETKNPLQIYRDSRAMVQLWRKRLTKAEIDRVKKGTEDIWPLFYQSADWSGEDSN